MRSIRKNRYSNETDLEKKERLRLLTETKQINRAKKYKNESMIEKEIRLAHRAEEYKYKSKRQKSESVMDDNSSKRQMSEPRESKGKKGKSFENGNKSDASYDAKQYMVRLQHILND